MTDREKVIEKIAEEIAKYCRLSIEDNYPLAERIIAQIKNKSDKKWMKELGKYKCSGSKEAGIYIGGKEFKILCSKMEASK